MGRRRRRLGVRMGAAGRCGVSGDDAPRDLAGVNWIDTAAVYGLGHSEEVVGQLLRALPPADRPFIFTKCGLVWNEHDRMANPQRVLKPASIRRECEASLRRLGVERIDLYQFHWPDETGTPIEDSWATMVRLIEE